jgi:hypothetical protein
LIIVTAVIRYTAVRPGLDLLVVAYAFGVLDIADLANLVGCVEFLETVVLNIVNTWFIKRDWKVLTAQVGKRLAGGPPGPPKPAPKGGRRPARPKLSAACSATSCKKMYMIIKKKVYFVARRPFLPPASSRKCGESGRTLSAGMWNYITIESFDFMLNAKAQQPSIRAAGRVRLVHDTARSSHTREMAVPSHA